MSKAVGSRGAAGAIPIRPIDSIFLAGSAGVNIVAAFAFNTPSGTVTMTFETVSLAPAGLLSAKGPMAGDEGTMMGRRSRRAGRGTRTRRCRDRRRRCRVRHIRDLFGGSRGHAVLG